MKIIKNIITQIIVPLVIFCAIPYNAQSQNFSQDKNIEIKVEVKYIDSEYLMIPKLIVLSKDTIQIPKEIFYNIETDDLADCTFYLQKQLKKCYAHLYVDALRERPFSNDAFTLKDFKKGDVMADTIYLKDYCPLEIGDYKIMIKFYYFFKGNRQPIYSDEFKFQVKFPPKNSSFE